MTSIAYLFAAFCIGYLHGRLRTHSPIVVMAIALFGTILAHLAMIALLVAIRPDASRSAICSLYVTLPTAFLNTLCSVPVYLALRPLHRRSAFPCWRRRRNENHHSARTESARRGSVSS